jgi:hypothetical protein
LRLADALLYISRARTGQTPKKNEE